MLGQILGDDGCRNARLVELAVEVQPGRDDGRLDRVEHVEAVGQLAKAVPLAAHLAALAVAADDPVFSAANAFVDQLFRPPDLEPPIFLAELFFNLAHGAAKIQRLQNTFFHQGSATGRLHHGGSHVATGNDAVLRARAGVHQIGLIEEVPVELGGLRILHQHMARLADAGEQLVDGLRSVGHRMLGPRTLLAHGVVAAIKRVKRCMRQPRLVKVQVLHVAVEHALDGFGVVEHTVVSRLRKRQHARLHLFGIHALEQWVLFDLGLDRGRLKLTFRNRANDAKVVARGFQENRNRPRHDDAVQDGFVAVAVHHHHITRRYGVVPHHFVRRAGAIGHEEAVVGVEDARRVALALANGAVVVEQLAQLLHRIADVGAQHVLTIELVVHLPHRAFEERHTTRMPWAVPGIRPILCVVEQRLEERRLHAFEVALGLADDVLGHELGRVLEHVDEAMELAQDIVGQVAAGLGFTVHVNRHIDVLAPHFSNEAAQAQHDWIQP